jgi:hypothetical protein
MDPAVHSGGPAIVKSNVARLAAADEQQLTRLDLEDATRVRACGDGQSEQHFRFSRFLSGALVSRQCFAVHLPSFQHLSPQRTTQTRDAKSGT